MLCPVCRGSGIDFKRSTKGKQVPCRECHGRGTIKLRRPNGRISKCPLNLYDREDGKRRR